MNLVSGCMPEKIVYERNKDGTYRVHFYGVKNIVNNDVIPINIEIPRAIIDFEDEHVLPTRVNMQLNNSVCVLRHDENHETELKSCKPVIKAMMSEGDIFINIEEIN